MIQGKKMRIFYIDNLESKNEQNFSIYWVKIHFCFALIVAHSQLFPNFTCIMQIMQDILFVNFR